MKTVVIMIISAGNEAWDDYGHFTVQVDFGVNGAIG